MQPQRKEFNQFRQRRVSTRRESRQQLLIRNNLEKRFYRTLNSLFRKFLNIQLYRYTEFGIFEEAIAEQDLNEEFIPLILSHYRRIFKIMYKNNEDKYMFDKKEEVIVFGRNKDIETVIEQYFLTRQLVLAGITTKMANRISKLIEQGRAENLTLPQIAKLVSNNFLSISRSRAALIARTETHNAASFANDSYHLMLQEDTGIKMLKRWVATIDDRTRSTHSEASGQIVDMNEDFMVGGVPMKYAGDSRGGAKNVINCRCVIVYADERDME